LKEPRPSSPLPRKMPRGPATWWDNDAPMAFPFPHLGSAPVEEDML
jgi:hypothetical protein